MERQTNDNPQTNMETLLNYAYDKDENVHFRYADEKYDVALHEFIAKNCPAEESADEIMEGACFDCDADCTYGLINSIAIQAAELRGRLKEYEDVCFDENGNERITIDHIAALAQAESEGRLVELPIAIGGKVYTIDDKYDHCRRCDFAKKHDLYDYCDCIEYCKQHDVTDDICPETEYEIKEHKVEGYEIRDENKLKASDAGEWGYEGLEKFNSYDGLDVYFSHEAAEAALAAKEGGNDD